MFSHGADNFEGEKIKNKTLISATVQQNNKTKLYIQLHLYHQIIMSARNISDFVEFKKKVISVEGARKP